MTATLAKTQSSTSSIVKAQPTSAMSHGLTWNKMNTSLYQAWLHGEDK